MKDQYLNHHMAGSKPADYHQLRDHADPDHRREEQ
jgi:hypothetical protein